MDTESPREVWTKTVTGRRFNLSVPKPEDVSIDEIGHHLGMQCRYNGGVSRFYSVAEHCVWVSELLKIRGFDLRMQLLGLLHDAAEAWTGDITSPMKSLVPNVRPIEARIQAAVLEAVPVQAPGEMEERAIKDADDTVGQTEIHPPINAQAEGWCPEDFPPNPNIKLVGLNDYQARDAFLARFYSLRHAMAGNGAD